MSHSLTFTLSFMCGETDAIVITRSPQNEMGCKHTPLTCEVRMQPVDCSRKFYNALGQRHLGCPTQPEIDPPKQSTEEMSELANSLSIWHGAILLSLQLLWSIRYGSVLEPGQKKRDGDTVSQYPSCSQSVFFYFFINSSVHTWAQYFCLQ